MLFFNAFLIKVNPINVIKLLLATLEAMQISETPIIKAEIELAENFEKILISAIDEVNDIETVYSNRHLVV